MRPRRPARSALLGVALLAATALPAAPAEARARRSRGLAATLQLDGEPTRVRWIDGDTFEVSSGPLAGRAARLSGCNTLETYGPVHRIGAATPEALLEVARAAAPLLAARRWRCTTLGRRDAYGRALVSCPDAAEALLRAGLALVFAVDGPAEPALLLAQREAQAARAGLWAGGVPAEVVTSLHSAGEQGLGDRGPSDRVVDTRTGLATARPHRRRYRPCQEVCLGARPVDACMVYVPFERRYRERPACLGARELTAPGAAAGPSSRVP